jgi:hypothetical protein
MTNLQKIRKFLKTIEATQTEKPMDEGGYIAEEYIVDGVTIRLLSNLNQDK